MMMPAADKPDDLALWEQARGELHGFANHLARSNAGITADQIRLAIKLGDEGAKVRAALPSTADDDACTCVTGACAVHPAPPLTGEERKRVEADLAATVPMTAPVAQIFYHDPATPAPEPTVRGITLRTRPLAPNVEKLIARAVNAAAAASKHTLDCASQVMPGYAPAPCNCGAVEREAKLAGEQLEAEAHGGGQPAPMPLLDKYHALERAARDLLALWPMWGSPFTPPPGLSMPVARRTLAAALDALGPETRGYTAAEILAAPVDLNQGSAPRPEADPESRARDIRATEEERERRGWK